MQDSNSLDPIANIAPFCAIVSGTIPYRFCLKQEAWRLAVFSTLGTPQWQTHS